MEEEKSTISKGITGQVGGNQEHGHINHSVLKSREWSTMPKASVMLSKRLASICCIWYLGSHWCDWSELISVAAMGEDRKLVQERCDGRCY